MKRNENKCLYCYNILDEEDEDFHSKCRRKFFGSGKPSEIDLTLNDIQQFAITNLGKSISVTGVQPKISLERGEYNKRKRRYTLVGGKYILKPPVEEYPGMPEIEDVTMHLARLLKIRTAEHSLIRLKSGEIAFITKRFDRTDTGKLACEDMAQLTGTLTENKYRGSMEKIAKVIKRYSSYPVFDLISFYELTLFCFITGNADMHLKNFSLLTTIDNEVMLAPAYDLLSTKLLIPQDDEELALPLNGKKRDLRKNDFIHFAETISLNEKSVNNIHLKFQKQEESLYAFIEKSFLSPEMKSEYKKLIKQRMNRIFNDDK